MRHVLNESYRKIPELLQTALGSMEEETFKDQHKEGQQKESIQVEPQDEADSLLSNGEEEMSSHNEEKKLDNALESAGCGLFQVILTLVCGLALGSDTTEISCVSYIVPVAEGELHLDGVDKAVLNSTVFVGMIFGSMFWGSLADSIGRRKSLVISLLLNGISGFVSAFMPNLEGFAFFRFLSGIGVGGSLPVVISYFAEFFSTKRKGPYVVLLSMMWILFGVYAPLLGWALLHNPCIIDTHLGSMPFRAWRVYVLLCTIPALLSAVFFIVMPESPSWHYSVCCVCICNCICTCMPV
jgi:VNT family MFS transporter (synaptic vesicle glycoprotein 2)